jgi:putative ABC transport system substrate-binding protein
MRRRSFITLLGGAAAAWPLAAQGQQPKMPVIGFLSTRRRETTDTLYISALQEGLKPFGYIDGQNIAIESRWAEGHNDRLPALALDLVNRGVSIIVGNSVTAEAAKAATATIPILFVAGNDPVERGLVASLNRPGGNVTGVFHFTNDLDPKRLGLLRELIPTASMIAVLLNPKAPNAATQLKGIQEGARAVGQEIRVLDAASESEIDAAFAKLAQERPGSLLVGADPFFNGRRNQIIALAAHYRIPAIYEWREFVEAGGLASYGTSLIEAYRQIGIYAGRILRGEKISDLPVMQSVKFEFVLNLKTAKSLGLTLPPTLLARADEVIE